MWYVSRLRVVETMRKQTEVDVISTVPGGACPMVLVTFTDSETGVKYNISTLEEKRMMALFEAYHPYGFACVMDGDACAYWTFVIVDELSAIFSSYIASVEEVTVPPGDEKFDDPKFKLASELVTFADLVDGSVDLLHLNFSMVHGGSGSAYGTLLQVLRYAQVGWSGDDFYLFHRVLSLAEDGSAEFRESIRAYKYQFTDIKKARAFLAKAAVMNYNPLLKKCGALVV